MQNLAAMKIEQNRRRQRNRKIFHVFHCGIIAQGICFGLFELAKPFAG